MGQNIVLYSSKKSKARTIKRIANGFKTFLHRAQERRDDV